MQILNQHIPDGVRRELVVGRPEAAAFGLAHYLEIARAEQAAFLRQRERAIAAEFTSNPLAARLYARCARHAGALHSALGTTTPPEPVSKRTRNLAGPATWEAMDPVPPPLLLLASRAT